MGGYDDINGSKLGSAIDDWKLASVAGLVDFYSTVHTCSS